MQMPLSDSKLGLGCICFSREYDRAMWDVNRSPAEAERKVENLAPAPFDAAPLRQEFLLCREDLILCEGRPGTISSKNVNWVYRLLDLIGQTARTTSREIPDTIWGVHELSPRSF